MRRGSSCWPSDPSSTDVRTLIDAPFLSAVDQVAREEKLLVREPSRALVGAIQEVSAAYNALGRDERARRPSTALPDALSARLHFFLPRDVGKAYEAARDLMPRLVQGACVRAVDVGAGLGASALGLAMAVRDLRPDVTLALTLIDDDRAAMAIAEKLLVRLFPEVAAAARFLSEPLSAFSPQGDVDLVLASNVLCELERGTELNLRADRLAALLHRWTRGLAPDGHLVIIEPALKSTARALQAQRARLIAGGFSIVAPCTHLKACPLLVDEGDWCHEDRAISLPSALIPIARAAGLHYEGLTFSYLIVSRASLPVRTARGRVVAPPRDAKGKRGLSLCHDGGDAARGTLSEFERLERHRGPSRDAWVAAERGSVLSMNPWPEPGRIDGEVSIARLENGER